MLIKSLKDVFFNLLAQLEQIALSGQANVTGTLAKLIAKAKEQVYHIIQQTKQTILIPVSFYKKFKAKIFFYKKHENGIN